jgi:hypothetical protein
MTHVEKDGSVTISWTPGHHVRGHANLLVKLEANSIRAREIHLTSSEGLRASEVQRFAWGRWFAVADAARRLQPHGTRYVRADDDVSLVPPYPPQSYLFAREHLDHTITAAIDRKRPPKTIHAKRPGRRGHPPEFYEEIASHYRELYRAGDRQPTKSIATAENVSRGTAAGWVGEARRRGLLGKARPGQPG